jgi:hypothetical protein
MTSNPNSPKSFTHEDLMKLTEKLKTVQRPMIGLVAQPQWRAILENKIRRIELEERGSSSIPPATAAIAFGLQVYEKADQARSAWVFRDQTLMHDYLDGKVSELQLCMGAGKGQCFALQDARLCESPWKLN